MFHDCTEGYIRKGAPGELARVPAHKSLLRSEPGKGLPIGNLNGQFFANVYLNGLDQFVEHARCCRHYPRYCLSGPRLLLMRAAQGVGAGCPWASAAAKRQAGQVRWWPKAGAP